MIDVRERLPSARRESAGADSDGSRPAPAPPRRPWRVYPRHRLDVGFADLAFALAACAFARGGEAEHERTQREVGAPDAVVSVSLRSGFELLLDALAFPEGSEILVSAVTHPDMARIVERHRLVPVPIDLDVATLAPRLDLLERAVTPRTRAVLVAHLFGGRVDLDPVVRLARRHGLVLVEDCAQSFAGPGDRGDEHAAVSLFSFGSIKTCAALGGGVVCVRLPGLAERMRDLERSWPRQRRRDYAARALWLAGLRALGAPLVYGLFVRLGAAAGLDTDALVNGAVHALRPPASADALAFERWLRRRPSAPLLAVLRRRLGSFDHARLRGRAALGEELARRLPAGLVHPGAAALARTHWVFPVVAPDPRALVGTLAAAGFDATRATTSIAAIEPPAGSPVPRPDAAVALMEDVVFLPAYPELPPSAVDRLVDALTSVGEERGR